jgi:hypothetical protein
MDVSGGAEIVISASEATSPLLSGGKGSASLPEAVAFADAGLALRLARGFRMR